MTATTLARYYRTLDEGRIDDALELLDPEVRFTIVLPSGTRRGSSREEMGGYLSGRGVSDRVHVVLRESQDGRRRVPLRQGHRRRRPPPAASCRAYASGPTA